MKTKNTTPLTKQDLQEALAKIATNANLHIVEREINSLTKEVVALKKDFNTVKHDVKNLSNELDTMELKIDIKLDKLEMAIDDKSREYRDQILTKLVGVMGELEKIREENTIGTYQASEHEKRIKRLEQTRPAA